MSVVAEGSHFIPMGDDDVNKPQFHDEKNPSAGDDTSKIEEIPEEKPRSMEDLPEVGID